MTENFAPEWDTVYTLDGSMTVEEELRAYAPEVNLALAPDDVAVTYNWEALKGFTGQHGYAGAVMHVSEQWGQWALDALAEIAVRENIPAIQFALVEVRDVDGSFPEGDAIGWAVAYRIP